MTDYLTHEEMLEIAYDREKENESIQQKTMKNTTSTQEKVLDLIQQYCDVLRTNYQSFAIQAHRTSIANDNNVEYHQEQIDKLCMGEGLYNYTYEKGRKYAKIVMHTSYGSRSAHMFVDMNTGDCYKAATWKSPAKGIRYNLLDDKSREEMYKRADWSGSHLYK